MEGDPEASLLSFMKPLGSYCYKFTGGPKTTMGLGDAAPAGGWREGPTPQASPLPPERAGRAFRGPQRPVCTTGSWVPGVSSVRLTDRTADNRALCHKEMLPRWKKQNPGGKYDKTAMVAHLL